MANAEVESPGITAASFNDTTFRGYSSDQALEYSQRRGGYPIALIDEVIKIHKEHGSGFDCVLDLGCGPGNATREIAAYFDNAIGLDPSIGMVRTATQIGGNAATSEIRFLHGDAETCDGIPDGTVDLIIAATAAHWFDMERFWPAAARVLRANGTVAFFTIYRFWPHPMLTTHADQVAHLLQQLETRTLLPHQKEGNRLVMNLYRDLRMPWQLSTPCEVFPQSHYRRQVWNEDCLARDGGPYLCGERTRSLDEAERSMGTASAVTRWREANPQLAYTEKDCVKELVARIRDIIAPQQTITMIGPTVLVSVRKG